MLSNDSIIYEQPLNEQIRICLLLEQLFQQVDHHITDNSPWGSRATLAAIFDIVSIIERPDLKGKLAKTLSAQALYLTRLEKLPDVDTKKLKELLIEIDRLINGIQIPAGKLTQTLRENEFLNTVQMHLYRAGGTAGFNIPIFHFWLQQPTEQRTRMLVHWLKELELIRDTVEILLELIRESTKSLIKFATQGFYQETLDANIPYQLVRVILSPERKVYPEISVGRHRLSIHFYAPSFEQRPTRITHDIPFKLATCV